jgi:hypothetical protein
MPISLYVYSFCPGSGSQAVESLKVQDISKETGLMLQECAFVLENATAGYAYFWRFPEQAAWPAYS